MANSNQPTPAEWAIMGGGLAALIGSFLDFAGDTNAWGSGALPIVTLIPIYATLMAVHVAATKFGNVNLPDTVIGLTWNQIHMALGFFASLMALFWLVAAEDTGAGLLIMLVGSVAALVGAFLRQRDAAAPGTGTIG